MTTTHDAARRQEPPRMKRYLISFYQPGDGTPAPPEVLEPVMREIATIKRDLEAANCWVFGNGLHPPSTATVLRAQGDDVLLTDGPFVEGKEHVGGLMIIDAPDLDDALQWGLRYARATRLPIEVRPFQGKSVS
jgi:hypothetical protein